MSNALHEGHGDSHGEVRVEESTLPNKSVFGFVAITALVFFGTAATLPTVFHRYIDQMRANPEDPVASQELVKLRAEETERLSTYGYIDKGKQIVHIPIEVAMQKVVEEAKK